MKSILIINSDQRNGWTVSHRGAYHVHFVTLVHPNDLKYIRGHTYDDVVWVRPLYWEDKYRVELEAAVKMRIRVDESQDR